ncbi:MAG: DUF2971 domain-containing protein [Parcubacteria group bacterium]|nr:DUF2971 domain-containing protein [Parcubacteria group bacterium]
MKTEFLRRYTNLPSLLDILSNKRLTLLDPANWDDRNDYYFIEQYKKKKELKSVLALCFTGRGETYHHWKIFSDGSSGICIVFKKEVLLQDLEQLNESIDLTHHNVKYKKINDKNNKLIKIDELPFIKRLPYKDEKEYRVIYKSKTEEVSFKELKISLKSIDKIIINPWIPKLLHAAVRKTIKDLKDCDKIKVYKTTLISNEQWKKMGENICITNG